VLITSSSECNPSASTLVKMVDELERSIKSNDWDALVTDDPRILGFHRI
jgi:hypothetical protein